MRLSTRSQASLRRIPDFADNMTRNTTYAVQLGNQGGIVHSSRYNVLKIRIVLPFRPDLSSTRRNTSSTRHHPSNCWLLLICLVLVSRGFAATDPTSATQNGIVSIVSSKDSGVKNGIGTIIHADEHDICAVTLSDLLGEAKSVDVRLPGSSNAVAATVVWIAAGNTDKDKVWQAVLRFDYRPALHTKLSIMPPALPHVGYRRNPSGRLSVGGDSDRSIQCNGSKHGKSYTFALGSHPPTASSFCCDRPYDSA